MPFTLPVYAQEPDGLEECFYLVNLYFPHCHPRWFIHLQESFNTVIILLGRIYCIQNMSVAINQCIVVHLRDKV